MADVEAETIPKTTLSGPRSAGDAPQIARGQIERLVPANPLPTGIRIGFWPGALQGIAQAFRVIDQLGRGPPFGAERLPGRMRRIRLERDEAAVFRAGNRPATRDAQRAITMRAFDGSGSDHE